MQPQERMEEKNWSAAVAAAEGMVGILERGL